MNWLINNWYLAVSAIALISFIIVLLVKFFKLPTKTQINKLKEWLLFAVIEAEKELGSGTGQLKLRYVYDLFLARFTWLAKVITFEKFSNLVDEALDNMKELLNNNKQINTYVTKK